MFSRTKSSCTPLKETLTRIYRYRHRGGFIVIGMNLSRVRAERDQPFDRQDITCMLWAIPTTWLPKADLPTSYKRDTERFNLLLGLMGLKIVDYMTARKIQQQKAKKSSHLKK
jgi:hypothetical protein